MNHPSSGNSIIPTDQEHDDHYAHRCICGVVFSNREPMFDTTAGYLCETCADKHDSQPHRCSQCDEPVESDDEELCEECERQNHIEHRADILHYLMKEHN